MGQITKKISKCGINLTSNDIAYILAINSLFEENEKLKKVSLARLLDIKKPSITKKIQALKVMNILEEDNRKLRFSDSGKEIAQLLSFQLHKLCSALQTKFRCDEDTSKIIAQNIIIHTNEETLNSLMNNC